MLIKTILNHIQKYNSFVYDSVTLSRTKAGEQCLIIKIISRSNGNRLCSKCQTVCPGYDRLKARLFQFVPLWGIPVFFSYAPKRVSCPTHGVVVEYLPWAEGKSSLTNTFKIYLSQWAKMLSWNKVAELFNVNWYQVFYAVEYVVEYGLKHRCLNNITAIGVDEIQYRVGYVYLTLIYQINSHCRRLLYVCQDRKAKSLLRFFRQFGKERSRYIKVACTDMWRAYLKVIRKMIPHALHILDRFHIMKMFNEAIDKTRRQEIKELKEDGFEHILKKSRWCLLKRKENQSASQLARLKELLKYNLKSIKCMLLRDSFQKFWQYRSPYWAEVFFKQWMLKVKNSNLDEMKKVASTLERHYELIFNYFKTEERFSMGIIEGFNNKAKLAMRKAYGFKQFRTIQVALYHQLGKLPEPILTHKFI